MQNDNVIRIVRSMTDNHLLGTIEMVDGGYQYIPENPNHFKPEPCKTLEEV